MVEGFEVLYLQSSCQCPRNIRALVYLIIYSPIFRFSFYFFSLCSSWSDVSIGSGNNPW